MKLSFCIVALLLCMQLCAQKSVNDSLRQRIDSLEYLMKEKNYSRIPIGDLDKSLDVRVQTEVYNAFYKYLAILGLFLFGGGFGLYRSLQGELKSQVESAVKASSEAFVQQLKEMSEIQNRENGRQDVLIKTMTDSIASLSAKQESFLANVSVDTEKKISEATRIMWNDIADNKLRTAKESKYLGGVFARELNDFIENDAVKVGNEKKQQLVDALIRCLYHTADGELKQNGYDSKADSMIKLIQKHEASMDLLPETYVNAAITLNNNYEYYRNAEDKRLCLDCCDKALLKLKDYGIPFILKLELYCMDYKNAYDQSEKDVSLDQLRRTFHTLNNSQTGVIHYEAVERLQVDKRVAYLKQYLELLDQICHDELATLKEKAMKFFVSRDVMNVDTYKNIFLGVLDEESIAHDAMNGKWQATRSVKAGVEAGPQDNLTEMTIDKYVFSLKENAGIEAGYIHYVNYKDRQAINLYFFDADNKFIQAAYCLSKLNDNGVWTLCSNYTNEDRPVDFVSDAANKYYLEEFVRGNG